MPIDFGYTEEDQLGKPYDIGLLRQLWPFVAPFRKRLLVVTLIVAAITLLELTIPYMTKTAVDRYIVPVNPALAVQTEKDGQAGHVLVVDLAKERQRRIVERYPHLFRLDDQQAIITLQDTARLTKSDRFVLRTADLHGITILAGLLLMIIGFNFAFNFIQVVLMETAGQGIMHDLRLRLYDHIQHMSISYFNHNPVGRLVTRVTNDIQNMHELFTSVITFVVKDVFLLVGIAAALLLLNWRLALATFVILPFVFLASFRFASLARDVFRTLRIKVAEINAHISETIGGIRLIQLFGQQSHNARIFQRMNRENFEAGMRQIHVFAIFMPVIEVLAAVALAAIILYGGHQVLESELSLGALAAFIAYIRMFFRPIRDIAEKYNVLQNAMASAERIFLILNNPDREAAAPAQAVSSSWHIERITFDKVVFAYNPAEIILRDLSFDLQRGQTLAVVGPTGSGKTTLASLLVGFYQPSGGRILINGQDIQELDLYTLRSRIAFVMQDPHLFSASLRANIFPADQQPDAATVKEVIATANCHSLVSKLPAAIETPLTKGGANLSTGERQLVAMARALARDPDVIILDEATAHIDSNTEEAIQQALANLLVGRTAIIIAHRLATARNADRIMVMQRGRIIETGAHAELMALKGFYYRLNQIQNNGL